MSTSLQNSMGHLYGPGQTFETEGKFPAWLDQRGSRIMGGIVRLDANVGTHKVSDLWKDGYIRTGTMCVIGDNKELTPIPTYRVVGNLTSAATKLVLANWFGLAKLVNGSKIQLPGNAAKSITINTATTGGNTKVNADGNYEVTIAADALGTLKEGDALILDAADSMVPDGLTKTNLDFRGLTTFTGYTLNVTLIDEGRIEGNMIAAVPASWKNTYLQTIKFEK